MCKVLAAVTVLALVAVVGCGSGATTKVDAPSGWTTSHEVNSVTGKTTVKATKGSETVVLEVTPKPDAQPALVSTTTTDENKEEKRSWYNPRGWF